MVQGSDRKGDDWNGEPRNVIDWRGSWIAMDGVGQERIGVVRGEKRTGEHWRDKDMKGVVHGWNWIG